MLDGVCLRLVAVEEDLLACHEGILESSRYMVDLYFVVGVDNGAESVAVGRHFKKHPVLSHGALCGNCKNLPVFGV